MYTSITITTVKKDIEHFCPPKKFFCVPFSSLSPPAHPMQPGIYFLSL